ncbi:MAG: SprT family zinc-dependent metalloprotease [Sulfurimonas sp.]|nr:SprT family zinc-dependent metalloprotease [Sulfurimonas sp.]MDQ7061504.1 SprT family zinc-dependent metalloprotease [Sulfurimonas sp.]
MNKLFVYDNFIVNHRINKNMKHSYISLINESEILLKTPHVSQKFIHSLLESKKEWIHKQILKAQNNKALQVNLEDEAILFGEIYSIDSLEVIDLRKKLEKIKITSREKIIKGYNIFYKEYSNEYITPRVEYFSNLMGYRYKEIKYRKMKSRWGSCSWAGVLTFNTELMKVKKELIDYVVVHELAHLKHMNHSKDFHSLVDLYLPQSKTYRKALKNIRIATF